jgi:hypothetical protein
MEIDFIDHHPMFLLCNFIFFSSLSYSRNAAHKFLSYMANNVYKYIPYTIILS